MQFFRPLFLFSLVLFAPISFAQDIGAKRFTNVETKGNLESLNELGCAPPGKLRNSYTPADLYRSTAECIKLADYDSALYSSALAGVYARYDTMRVADSTAHQAPTVLQMKYLGSVAEERKKIFMTKLSDTARNPDKLLALCADIRKIGAPNYHPSYMIQHGMNAVLGANAENALVPNFDSKTSWDKSLNAYLHCPEPKDF